MNIKRAQQKLSNLNKIKKIKKKKKTEPQGLVEQFQKTQYTCNWNPEEKRLGLKKIFE